VLHRYDGRSERTPRETDLFRALDDHTVLFAFDGSEQARAAILEAAHLLGPNRYAIVLTVWRPLAAPPSAGAASPAPPDLENRRKESATMLAYEGARLARSIGFDAKPIVASGDPVWRSIVDCADGHDAGIVVLGSSRGADASLTQTGSVAAAVARHTKRPVLIIEAGSAERATSTVPIVHASPAARAA
jgi:nucleotide-binding universal stress UspA family protein